MYNAQQDAHVVLVLVGVEMAEMAELHSISGSGGGGINSCSAATKGWGGIPGEDGTAVGSGGGELVDILLVTGQTLAEQVQMEWLKYSGNFILIIFISLLQ